MIRVRRLKQLDWRLVAAIFALVLLTWPYMRSASYRSGRGGDGYYTSSPQKQIAWVVVSSAVALALLIPGYRALAQTSVFAYGGGLLLLALVLLFGRVINGAKSWLVLTGSVRLQPSELAKITTLLLLAHVLSDRHKVGRMRQVAGVLALAAVPAAMIAAQPDLGTALMFVPMAVAMVFVAGARPRHLLVLALAAVAAAPVFWSGMSESQRSRVTVWLRQNKELTRTERVGRFHHRLQSTIAIGSGGWTGRGLGNGRQNRLNYVGFRNTDFIFAVICEEAGFLGANIVILGYLLFAGAGLSIAARCREPTGRLIAVGAVALLVTQGLVNIGMATGLLPIVGVTLPFVSYGGSSLLSSFLAISLILNVGLRRPRITFAREELGEVA
ncbi:MAG: FtsW/RodA/SpoVE family cell cycle protein [Planctomycetota bacterium]